ncbi:sterol desaturase/sphingolipid hydroxylase (fatty acid hydroxylase superfamily) [Variovorax boronicumulans]|uniref:Sterol desaturase/sphingolipid hydroxylase (Fatty acid hydroxylase superfamily) n=1 Tax=Variovorax boronicumulans TaxID=436515 RepID=A0AAW8CZF0_9BURK|nr:MULTISPECIES: sterol desaturase family protein [Variovorax]MDP9893251.1 sterol desaturase/sphingolipid hydroxylase (fatty acid hydroxylase superfamily) [Variovorax boronicumulans]MDQ0032478.1 sterol desaturase/sphingolipid hydroxylase (fatty acid hydroxylase superfamily) [Variovorax boronicumulans]MDQ0052405.1 sterol desaturase/sphingolipid hydroxylase (fatty acid hydroxylase superfamily) [Variovorax boronicumulans]MDQ0609729.1 sterol desaturase/sphingolipid hydroxylase (fatty acid hydroxyla
MIDWLTDLFSALQGWFFEAVVQPLVYAVGLGGWTEDAFDATGWLLVGFIQIVVLLAVIGPLQRWRSVEPVVDRHAIRIDVLYTLIHKLGLFRLALFFTLQPFFDDALGSLRTAGWGTFHLDEVWPGVTDVPVVAFAIYLVVLDFVGYWIHRGQHQFNWWWGLHSLHHSQRQMTMWSDDRNHLVDDIVHDAIIVIVAQLIGVAPGQFIAFVAFTQLSESLQHANLRLSFGAIGERLWVSPRFHRLHHSIGLGHESRGKSTLGGHNFGVLLPWWDMLFRTANFEDRYDPTGIRDQVEPDALGRTRDYGRGFWAQQWLGLKRMVGRG